MILFAYNRRCAVKCAVLVTAALSFVLLVSMPTACQSFSIRTPTAAATTTTTTTRDAVALQAVQEQQQLETTTTTATANDELSSSSSSSSLSSSWFPENRQVLTFVEPQTNVTVVLIGSMHYNPASIQLVEDTVEDLGATNMLGSVIIESCDIRWNKTQEIMDKKNAKTTAAVVANDNDNDNEAAQEFIDSNPNDKDFLGNEMRAAWEVATRYHRPTVLGDQRINITMDALKDSLKGTAKDLFLGGPSGWERSRDEIVANWKKTVPISAGQPVPVAASSTTAETRYLNAFAFFDPRLLISLPVSLVKYPLSFLIKDPIPVGTVFAIIAVLNFYGSGGDFDVGGDKFDFSLQDWVATATTIKTYDWTDYVVSVAIAVLETVVFARLLLKPLLADRNEILARSVLDQCLLYADNGNGIASTSNSFGNWFQSLLSSQSQSQSPAILGEGDPESPVYVPGSDPKSMLVAEKQQLLSNKNNKNSNEGGKVVVAVLGMAHCNGVMKLLREQRV